MKVKYNNKFIRIELEDVNNFEIINDFFRKISKRNNIFLQTLNIHPNFEKGIVEETKINDCKKPLRKYQLKKINFNNFWYECMYGELYIFEKKYDWENFKNDNRLNIFKILKKDGLLLTATFNDLCEITIYVSSKYKDEVEKLLDDLDIKYCYVKSFFLK